MSEREEVMREFTRTAKSVMGEPSASYTDRHAMADEIVRLRLQLAAAGGLSPVDREQMREVVTFAHELGWNGVENSKILSVFLRDYVTTTERERDEARRERDEREALVKELRQTNASAQKAIAHLRHRAERDAKRLEWLQRNATDVTCVDPESDASAWAIKYMNSADLDGPELIATGSTLVEAIDRALDAHHASEREG